MLLWFLRVNCFPQTVHLKTCLNPEIGLLDLERLIVNFVMFGLGVENSLEVRVSKGAEIGPTEVSSIGCFGIKGIFVASAD